jgi:hypothetical protein
VNPLERTAAAILATAALAAAPQERKVVPIPPETREAFRLSPFYAKMIDADGFPIVASEKVSDFALREAAYLIDAMLGARRDLREALVRARVRFSVMAAEEFTTDIPEHADLTPKDYWDRRARGLGATSIRPSVSCGEENLLCAPGDPYGTENILIHEFAHAIHEMALNAVDASFDGRLARTYRAAKDAGLWKGTYAATNRNEYWAEGVQSWFDTNRRDDAEHNHVDTREKLKAYDPALAGLIAEVFGEGPWRYVRPEKRPEPGHLAGYDRAKAKTFAWPDRLKNVDLRKKP